MFGEHLARFKEKNAGRNNGLRDVKVLSDEVVPNFGGSLAACLDAVLGDYSGWSGAENPVVCDFSIGAGVADRRPVLLVSIDDIAHDFSGANGNVWGGKISRTGLKASPHLNRHPVLAAAKGIVPDFGDVIP